MFTALDKEVLRLNSDRYQRAWQDYLEKDLMLMGGLRLSEVIKKVSQYTQEDKKYHASIQYQSWQYYLENMFIATGNPLFVWESINYSRENGVSLNEEAWTEQYLKETAINLLDIANSKAEKESLSSRVQSAIGLKKSKGTLFHDWKKSKNELFIALLVHEMIIDKHSLRQAAEYVSKLTRIKDNQPLSEENKRSYNLTGNALPNKQYLDFNMHGIKSMGRTTIEALYNKYKSILPENLTDS